MEELPFDKESMEHEGLLPRNIRRKHGLPEYGPSGLTPEEEKAIIGQELTEKIQQQLQAGIEEEVKINEPERKKKEIPWQLRKRREKYGILSPRLRKKHGLPTEGPTGLNEEEERSLRQKEGLKGFENEKKVILSFVERQEKWPPWLKGVYKATSDQDRTEKTDIVFVTTSGEFRGQIKSSSISKKDLGHLSNMGIIPIYNVENWTHSSIYNRIIRKLQKKIEKQSN